jgi:protein tyrosine phosphatase
MIVEKECKVIVMLTKCLEGSENKCAPYFPKKGGDVLKV